MGASAKGPWLLEEILRWGTAELFDPAAHHAAAQARDPAPQQERRAAGADEDAKPAAMETDGQAGAAEPGITEKGSNADSSADSKPEDEAKKGEAPPVVNEASAYTDDALDALIRWGTATADGATAGETFKADAPVAIFLCCCCNPLHKLLGHEVCMLMVSHKFLK